jgi:tetratricopeptide (TPR) repeat protein
MNEGLEQLEYGEVSSTPVQSFRQAATLRPDDARAQGLLALSVLINAEPVFNRGAGADVEEAQDAIGRALAIDPRQPEALLAIIALERSVLDMDGTETRLRDVLASSPDNFFALRDLWNLLQCGGRSVEALALVERAIAQKPLAASANYPRAQLLWIIGKVAEADRVIDRAMLYWPRHRFVRFARFMILAFTGRPEAALAMIENEATKPQNFSDASIALWKTLLPALGTRSAAAIDKARLASLQGTDKDPSLTAQSVMTLSAVGDLDSAFAIADKLLLFREAGDATARDAKALPASTAWRFTPWLFTPPCAAIRVDPRFNELCEGIGLTDYWRKRGVRPDPLQFRR